MVSADESRRVLEAIVSTHPDNGVILGVRLWDGWGNTLQVAIEARHDPDIGPAMKRAAADEIREAITVSTAPRRTMVTFDPVLTRPWLKI